jgi:hypothetical protein
VLELAGKDVNKGNNKILVGWIGFEASLRLLLHFTIVLANEKGQSNGQDLQEVGNDGPKYTGVFRCSSYTYNTV